jgi:threonine synthase
MSRCLAHFNKDKNESKNTVLVATSGDTGGAVASGFRVAGEVNHSLSIRKGEQYSKKTIDYFRAEY